MNFEKTECQYCGDAGFCEFCERGRLYASEQLSKQKTKDGGNGEEIKLTWANPDDGLDFDPQENITNRPRDRK